MFNPARLAAITVLLEAAETKHYYEAHVTIEPVFSLELERFKDIAKHHKFHVAKLLLNKEEFNRNDSFCTGRATSYKELLVRLESLLKYLRHWNFKVYRYKIESTLLDSKYGDTI